MAKMVVSISVVPIGTHGTSVSKYVSRAVSVIAGSGLPHRVGAGFTDVELEDYQQLASLLSSIESELARMDVARIDFFVKIDRRLDASLSIEGKISKVQEAGAAPGPSRAAP
ncbi:MAG: MTH1187 family thiamine-binding protein [Conexivisphaera sp.]